MEVALGVPAGMWLNRHVERSSARSAEAERRSRAEVALTLVQQAIEQNRVVLEQQRGLLPQGHIAVNPRFHVATWEVLKAEVVAHVRDPQLRRTLAEHFALIQRFTELLAMYLSYSKGVLSTYSSADEMKPLLQKTLSDIAEELLREAEKLTTAIREMKSA